MDEGSTRFIFDKWEFPYTRVEADEIRKRGLKDRYDALLFARRRSSVDHRVLFNALYHAGARQVATSSRNSGAQ